MLTHEVVVEGPDRPGFLARVFRALAHGGAETLGVATEGLQQGGRPWRRVRLLLRDQTEGAALLKHEGFSVRTTPVVYLQVGATVDRLDWALGRLQEAGIPVEGLYHAYAPGGPGLVLITPSPEKATELL